MIRLKTEWSQDKLRQSAVKTVHKGEIAAEGHVIRLYISASQLHIGECSNIETAADGSGERSENCRSKVPEKVLIKGTRS